MSAAHATPSPATRSEPASGAFSPRVAIWLIGAALVSAIMFVVLSTFGPQLRVDLGGGANALSRSAVGYAGLVKLLREEGAPVRLSRDPALETAAPSGLLLMTPQVGLEAPALPMKPLGHVAAIVTPKWVAIRDPKHLGWVQKMEPFDPNIISVSVLSPLTKATWSQPAPPPATDAKAAKHLIAKRPATSYLTRRQGRARPILHDADGFFTAGTQIKLGEIDQFQAFKQLPQGWERGLVDEQGNVVVAFDRSRRLFVVSDPDILNTQGLASLDGARAASTLINELRGGDDPVAVDLSLAGMGGGSPKYDVLRLMLTPPFLSATLCAVAAALLMGLHAAIRFGAEQRPGRAFALGKRALADNSAALVHMAGREAVMAPGYVALSRDLALEGVGVSRTDDAAAMQAHLDRIGEARGATSTLDGLERDARRATDGASLLAAAKALYQWRLEITRGR